jgi:dolichyl-phosphate-mannose--protein O-mannosyl transferase
LYLEELSLYLVSLYFYLADLSFSLVVLSCIWQSPVSGLAVLLSDGAVFVLGELLYLCFWWSYPGLYGTVIVSGLYLVELSLYLVELSCVCDRDILVFG